MVAVFVMQGVRYAMILTVFESIFDQVRSYFKIFLEFAACFPCDNKVNILRLFVSCSDICYKAIDRVFVLKHFYVG